MGNGPANNLIYDIVSSVPSRCALVRAHTRIIMSQMKSIYFFNTNLDFF